MIDLFYECEDFSVASHVDDTTPYSCVTDIPSVAFELQVSATKKNFCNFFFGLKITI